MATPEPPGSSIGLLRALPEGWELLGRCRIGAAGPASYPTGCYALAHPATGVALVDVAPDATPNAESRLRRALSAANFWPAFPGYLPVWHGRIELAAWRALPGIMAEGFSELPPLTVPGRAAWIAAARAALATDGGWDVPGTAAQAEPAFEEDGGEEPLPPPRLQRRGPMLALGFLATFALGLAAGAALFSESRPVTVAAAPAAVPSMVSAAPVAATLAEPPAPVQAVARPEPVPMPVPVVALAPAAVPLPASPMPPEPEAAPPAQADPVVPEPAATLPPPANDPVETVAVSLPLPPVAPKAPPKAAAPAPRFDRACTQALYRFQQGERLTPQEAAFVRDGCSTRR
ncbi:hypothetical protein [Paracraurococcus ruber]|uniref:Uncharacterized protein n=1 Tax=Paracraurococcus ruber TaxID=77675 RepID=A0ABS1CRQ3_9PROT|nr:hypothetical protein [Paracraurococcus ruber]MBK1657135.1 hypothetical protein [Paracraurococcus ruber]TDG31695.1 hypothetical protein E2C05_09940 [Paracraurococcus ruber]